MITYMPTGADIFSVDAAMIVCPVNTRGVMGAGLAKEVKNRFPFESEQYRRHCQCDSEGMIPGGVYIPRHSDEVAFLATKDHWRDPSRVEWVESGLRDLFWILDNSDTIVAIPALGCGLGGLDWEDVRQVIEKVARQYTVNVVVCPPMEQLP